MEPTERPLTAHQRDALNQLVRKINEGVRLLALVGLAGTGKTTLVPALKQALEDGGYTVDIGTPTHRAAMILRTKGIKGVDTIHALCMKPVFTEPYEAALRWLGWYVSEDSEEEAEQGDAEVPALVCAHLEAMPNPPHLDDLSALQASYPAPKILASIGIHGRHHLIGFGPKLGAGDVLIVDEASMVGQQLLALCQQAFRHVVLIGDSGQLPPVRDVAVLDTVPAVQLTEIHRQAADSPLIQLAYRARQGYPFWRHGLAEYAPVAAAYRELPAHLLLESPLITWRNATRIGCTRMIRAALDYPTDELVVGEPLVCRSTDPAARVDGFYNNALFRVVKTSPYDAREVTLKDDLSGEEVEAYVHLEELDGDNIELDAIPFRFGYCLTAHTAQGGEWPRVYISGPDLRSYAGFCWHNERLDELARWAYTSITRAREQLGLMTQHQFVK